VVTRPPQAYPWAVPLREGVLDDQGFRAADIGEPAPGQRTAVLASGSNASPEVVRDKLGPTLGAGADAHVVFTAVLVPGLGVGHSAHVSRPGYVAAAPYRQRDSRPAAALTFALAWFTPAQLARIDETEPQYRRLPLPVDLPARVRPGAAPVREVQLYVSRHGVLAQDEEPVTLRSQEELFTWLSVRLRCLRGRTLRDFVDAELREKVRLELAGGGWSVPSLLEHGPQR